MRPLPCLHLSLIQSLTALALGLSGLAGYPQNMATGGDSLKPGIHTISWISQFPPQEKDRKSKNVIGQIADAIAGKKDNPALSRPISVLPLNPDTFYVLDQGSRTLFLIRNRALEVPRFMRKQARELTSLVGICKMPGNELLFTDSHLNKIFLATTDKKELLELNDSLRLDQPTGIAFSEIKREIWVVETAAHRILVLDEKGRLLKSIGSRGTGTGEFNYPTSIWIDKAGNAFVVDAMNFRVQLFDKNGAFISAFGEIGDATGYFARPKGIAADSYGNIYVVDALLHAVQVFDKDGNYLYRFGQQGRNKEEFWMPSGIYIDSRDYIYVADSYNSRIQIFQLIPGK